MAFIAPKSEGKWEGMRLTLKRIYVIARVLVIVIYILGTMDVGHLLYRSPRALAPEDEVNK